MSNQETVINKNPDSNRKSLIVLYSGLLIYRKRVFLRLHEHEVLLKIVPKICLLFSHSGSSKKVWLIFQWEYMASSN